MAEKIKTYRIKNLENGLYYTGGIYGEYKNPNYETIEYKRGLIEKRTAGNWNYQEKKDNDYWHGPWPWNYYIKDKWNSVGKLFTNLRGAEKALSELTGTSVHTRKEKAKNILFGNKKSNIYVIVPCRILDKKVKLKEEENE